MVDASGRIRTPLLPITLEPGSADGTRSARQDFKFRFD
jgi:hypothetical protein